MYKERLKKIKALVKELHMNKIKDQQKFNSNGICKKNMHGYQVPTIFDFFSRPLTDFDFFEKNSQEENFKVDLKDCGDHYQLKADMPGVRKEDIKVDFEDGTLFINAEHHTQKESKDENGYIIKERTEGTYQRQFRFDDADPNDICAAFVGGELDISIKKNEKQNSHSIKIN